MYDDFEVRYRKCEKALFLIAVGFLHNTEDAKDCLQEAALSAFRLYESLKNKELFKTWITRILINKCKDMLKKRKYTDEFRDDINIFSKTPESISTLSFSLLVLLFKFLLTNKLKAIDKTDNKTQEIITKCILVSLFIFQLTYLYLIIYHFFKN